MIYFRRYGLAGPLVLVLHGGPAAVGSAAPIARRLAGAFRTIEPWQRGRRGEAVGSGERSREGGGAGTPEPLTVARHIADLRELIDADGEGESAPPALVGESWGAMLALAYAAAHPDAAGPIVLMGCGTFDRESRARMKETERARTTDAMRAQIARLEIDVPDPVERFVRKHEILAPTYLFDPMPDEPGAEAPLAFDKDAHQETWDDMMRLQREGLYPAALAAIRSPVLMLHGAYDPHPGRMIRDSLLPHIPRLEYREWEECGHYLWRERRVAQEVFAFMRDWIVRKLEGA